ncbi:MAG: nitroreductase family protein [Actinomycetia bacterium]|nr:nitroreductase family protein [Actinomycetes bacterium]
MSATTAVPLHPLLAARRSPRAFDPEPLTDRQVAALLEAARWAPSAMNAQPWQFVVGRHGDPAHKALFDALAHGNQVWAASAPLLVLALARTTSADGSPRPTAPYELGLAVAQLVLQAQADGLVAHQMGGFDAGLAAADLGVPAGWEPLVVVAVGRPGDVRALPDRLDLDIA